MLTGCPISGVLSVSESPISRSGGPISAIYQGVLSAIREGPYPDQGVLSVRVSYQRCPIRVPYQCRGSSQCYQGVLSGPISISYQAIREGVLSGCPIRVSYQGALSGGPIRGSYQCYQCVLSGPISVSYQAIRVSYNLSGCPIRVSYQSALSGGRISAIRVSYQPTSGPISVSYQDIRVSYIRMSYQGVISGGPIRV